MAGDQHWQGSTKTVSSNQIVRSTYRTSNLPPGVWCPETAPLSRLQRLAMPRPSSQPQVQAQHTVMSAILPQPAGNGLK